MEANLELRVSPVLTKGRRNSGLEIEWRRDKALANSRPRDSKIMQSSTCSHFGSIAILNTEKNLRTQQNSWSSSIFLKCVFLLKGVV